MRSTVTRLLNIHLVACALAVSGAALAEPSVLREASGSVEQQRNASQGGAWQLAGVGERIEQGLRVGTGRALIGSGAGQALLGSDSSLRIFQQEPDFQTGRVYLSGTVKFFAQAIHLAAEGQVRLDLTAPTRRLAVIAGTARLAIGTRQLTLGSGQQYNFTTGKVQPFSERDAWYASRFTGEGEARIEAVNGPVQLQTGSEPARAAQPSAPLRPGQQLLTGEGAWAEVGFTGGGYLRLQARSALSVLSIETVTGQGGRPQREVSLKLIRGSAWNVVAQGQGGYQLTTPTITTAVRGTVFRVDESGLVKVFDGQVALPSQADTLLATGKQRDQSGQLQTLVLDASDRANQALDAERAAPTRLNLDLGAALQNLTLGAQSQPGARLNLELTGPLSTRLALVGDRSGAFRLPDPAPSLPEGRYRLTLTAERLAGSKTLRRALIIDRSAPMLTLHLRRVGQTLLVKGEVSDALSRSLDLYATVDGTVHHRRLSLTPGTGLSTGPGTVPELGRAELTWLLPWPSSGAAPTLSATDEAGNVGYAAP